MKSLYVKPQLLEDRRVVAFGIEQAGSAVECAITIDALEMYFWLEPSASEERILTTFCNGYGRIRAIAERKLLAHPSSRLRLTAQDFAGR